MLVLAIDPGSTRSGWVVYSTSDKRVLAAGDDENSMICSLIAMWTEHPTPGARLVVEWFASHGQASMGAASMVEQARKMLVIPRNPTLQEAVAFCKQIENADSVLENAARMARMGATTTGDLCSTATWIGIFCAAAGQTPATVAKLTRKDVLKAMHIPSKGADAAVRAELIRHFGAGSEKKGGALAAVKGDAWAALAVAVVYAAQVEKDNQADEVIRKGVM